MRILLVCLGNICRSPTAEAALIEALAAAGLDHVEVDSAGTGSWHIGDPPDRRMVAAAAEQGLTLQGSARRITAADFDEFDLILCMDRQNLRDVQQLAPDEAARSKVRLFLEFASGTEGSDVPDPYYGGPNGFAQVVDIVRGGAQGLVRHLQEQESRA